MLDIRWEYNWCKYHSCNLWMTLFFVEASIHNIICFKATMRSFELVSWLKVNFHKSWLGDFGMDSHLVHRYAHLLCPCLSNTLGFLLGLIIGGSVYGKVSWISVGIGLVVGDINSWGGGVTLINLVISPLPLRIPVGVAQKITSLQRYFL